MDIEEETNDENTEEAVTETNENNEDDNEVQAEYFDEEIEELNADDKIEASKNKEDINEEFDNESQETLEEMFSEKVLTKEIVENEEDVIIEDEAPKVKLEELSPLRRTELAVNSKEIIRMFTKSEISEINQYVSTSVPFSQLNQFFLLSERPLIKAQIYTGVYRIIQSVSRYVASESTRTNINILLDETRDVYIEMYSVLVRYQNGVVNFNRHRLLRKIENFFLDADTNTKTNRLVDAFLVFVEKQELVDLDRIVGLDLDSPEGNKVYADISVDSTNVRE